MAVMSLLVFAASCKKEKPDNPQTDSLIFTNAIAGYYGTEYSEAYNYYTVLATEMEVDSNGYYASAGEAVTIDFFSADSVLAEGTYTLSAGTYAADTFDVEYTKWYEINDAGEETEFGIKSGSVTVSKSGEQYVFTVNLVDSLDQVRTGYYRGALLVEDQTSGGGNGDENYAGEPQTPTEVTLTIPTDSIAASNYGDYYESGTDNIYLEMWDANNNYIALELFTAKGATTLPVGTFNFATTYAANTILPGSLFWGIFPSGSFVSVGENLFWLEGGSVTIDLTGSTYTVTVAVTSHYGSTINATYTGTVQLEMVDGSTEPAPAKKMGKSVKQVSYQFFTKKR